MFIHRYTLALGISILALLISIALDRLLSPLSPLLQFVIQVPILVLIVDEGRHALIQAGFPTDDVNGAFFFAAPLAALGATSLFIDIRKTLRI
jgi:hypothetical protein